jgi:hypothetical protein
MEPGLDRLAMHFALGRELIIATKRNTANFASECAIPKARSSKVDALPIPAMKDNVLKYGIAEPGASHSYSLEAATAGAASGQADMSNSQVGFEEFAVFEVAGFKFWRLLNSCDRRRNL